MADDIKEREGSALVDEIKSAPTPEEISKTSPVVVVPAEAPVVVQEQANAEPVIDKRASEMIEAEKKATAKAQKEEAKKQAAIEKKAKKAAELQAKIEQCPKDYRPVSTGVFFWSGILCYFPVIGILFTILFSLIPRNKNFKHFARSILAYYVIALIVGLIFLIVITFAMGQSIADYIWPFQQFISEMKNALGF